MRQAFAHEATVAPRPTATTALPARRSPLRFVATGNTSRVAHWRLHHTRAVRAGDELRLRTLFVVEPELEDKVRQRIEAALAEPRLIGPGDVVTTWRLLASKAADVVAAEHDHAERLLQS